MMNLATSALKACGLALILAALGGTAMAHNAPEIDPGSAAGALTLLTSGMLLVTAKVRKK
jgi:hypothetical protein